MNEHDILAPASRSTAAPWLNWSRPWPRLRERAGLPIVPPWKPPRPLVWNRFSVGGS